VLLPAIVVIACVLVTPTAADVGNRMVVLNVRVTDPAGKAVTNLQQSSFHIIEDGVPQKISLFVNDKALLRYGLMIDNSGSMRSQFSDVVQAGNTVINSNEPDDETFLIRFIDSDKIETVTELTNDKAKLIEGVDSLYVEIGQTALIDAIYLGADYLVKQKADDRNVRRKALLLITDGEERISFYRKDNLFRLLGSSGIQVYIIALTNALEEKKREKAINFVSQLASETGGKAYFPSSATELGNISKEIINDIRRQYVIGYVPAGGDSKKAFHKIQVSITGDPNQEKRIAVTHVIQL
jgi:Ca-activated chloride channel family protein